MAQTTVGPHRGHAAGDTDIEKAASQLVSDIKYKVNKEMKDKGGASNLNPAQVAQKYMQKLGASPAPGPVKALAKKKLGGVKEEYAAEITELVKESVSKAVNKVFVEGIQKEDASENEYLEQLNEMEEKKYKIRVTDKKTKNTYVRMATRAKIAELRANPNIASVEMTSYGEPSRSEATKGSQTAAAKAGKDYDGDGKIESPAKEHAGAVHNAIQRKKGLKPDGKDTSSVKEGKDWDGDGKEESPEKEYRGVVHNAIQRKKGLKPDGKDTSSVKEEFIGEVKKEDEDKKKITGKGVNNYKTKSVKVFPEVTEEVTSNLATGVAKKKEVPDTKNKNLDQQNERTKQQEVQILQRKLQALRSSPRGSDPSIMASYEAQGDNIQEVAPPGFEGTVKGMKKHPELSQGKTSEGKKKNIYALAWWMKNKGYKSHRKASGAMKEEIFVEGPEDRLRDARMVRGGVGGNIDYTKPVKTTPSKPVDPKKHAETSKKALEIIKNKYKGSLM